ncbi:dienelactone hydrolase [Rhizobiales bacterium RZME27]|uniref:Dienelactone hydrolase n=2 Tax=Endobacterium cereale TaxID=2663029 RepID=A0A6A8A1P8_9HYPH|nr:dienelactone hydrolase [Endobacterium cereale]
MLTPELALCKDVPPSSYTAGISRMSVADEDGAFDTMIWYPTAGPETPWSAGPFTLAATRDADIASGQRFPIVLLSHGSGGSPMGHRELSASLARRGFVVVSPVHVGDASGHPRFKPQLKILKARPRQAAAALNAILTDRRFAVHLDGDRVAVIGYSAGGYTALAISGARPDLQLASTYCSGDGREDVGACGPVRSGPPPATTLPDIWPPPTVPQIKALVLMDPLSMLFDRSGLASVTMPALLFRPRNDAYLRATGNALGLARNFPSVPEQIVVPGSHFVFIDPCPAELMQEAAAVCRDEDGVDRVKIHRDIESDIAAFLHQNL